MSYKKMISELKKLYKEYLGNEDLENYLIKTEKSNAGDEGAKTDPLLEKILKNKYLFGYTEPNSILQQQPHKTKIGNKIIILKPDFETNNEICKNPFLFDAKSSNIPLKELLEGETFKHTFERYLLNIKPSYEAIMGFNLKYFILYERNDKNNVIPTLIIDVIKLFENDKEEKNNFIKLINKLKFERLDFNDKINFLRNKKYDTSSLDTDRFIKKFILTKNKLYNFFLEHLEKIDFDIIKKEFKNELTEFLDDKKTSEKEKINNVYIQLAHRLTLLEYFKFMFVRIYEDNKLIHKLDKKEIKTLKQHIKNIGDIVPATYGDAIIDRAKYISNISTIKTKEDFFSFLDSYFSLLGNIYKEIGDKYFEGFSTLFNKYEDFINDYLINVNNEQKYKELKFDIVYFLNEFNFTEIDEEGQDLVGNLFEKTLERTDRKKFGQFYTPRYIIEFILDELNIQPDKDKKILDPACGTGGFLMKYLAKVKGKNLLKEDILENIFNGTYGVDIKVFSTLLTKLNLALLFIIKNKDLKQKNIRKLKTDHIITGDGLELDKKLDLPNNFDYVVGNPPYVGIKGNSDIISKIKKDDFYKQAFYSKPDLYYFFILQGVRKLKEGGKFGYIIPREWMTADFAEGLRQFLLKNTKIIKIIDFNDDIRIFEDAGTTSSILLLEKRKAEKDYSFEYIKFIKKDGLNIIDYVNKYVEKNKKNITDINTQKLSGREIFEQKIIAKETFDKLIKAKKEGETFSIPELPEINLTEFIEIKEAKYGDLINEENNNLNKEDKNTNKKKKEEKLTPNPWIFDKGIVKNDKLVELQEILKVSQGIVSGADKVNKRHIQKGLAPANYEGRGIFVLKEGKEIKGPGLEDIKKGKETIGDIQINLYENGGWTSLNKNEKKLIKPLYFGKELNKWNLKENNEWIIYNNPANPNDKYSVKNYDGKYYDEEIYSKKYTNIYTHLMSFIKILKARNPVNSRPYWKKGHFLNLDKFKGDVSFEKAKIIFNTKTIDFTYFDKPAYGNGGGLGGLNFIFTNPKNPYTQEIKKYSSEEDYLKFVNAVLNSDILLNNIKNSGFNSLSVDKIRHILIPKIDFTNKEQKERYEKIVKLANKLIDIYNNSDSKFKRLEKDFLDCNENSSLSFKEFLQTKEFETKDGEAGFRVIIDNEEFFGLDDYKDKLINCEKGKTIGECLGIEGNNLENSEEVKKIEKEINELVKWFYEGEETKEETNTSLFNEDTFA